MKKIIIIVLVCILPVFVFGQVSRKIANYFKRAETAIKSENYADAIDEYERIINLYPDNADAYLKLATTCEQLKNDEFYLRKAINAYKMYIKLVPSKEKEISEKIYQLEYTEENKSKDINIEPRYKLKRIVATVAINALLTNALPDDYSYYDYNYTYYDYYYRYDNYSFHEDCSKYSKGKGFAISTDLLFISKNSLNKQVKYGLSMSLELAVPSFDEQYECIEYREYYDAEYEFNINNSEHIRSGFAFQYMLGVSGISKISDKLWITCGIYPAGIIVGIVNVDKNKILGLTHSANLGIGLQLSRKCILNPNIKFSFCSTAIDTKLVMFQAGIALKFLNYKTY